MNNNELYFSTIENKDLNEIRKLQPEGWSDIIPDIRFYVDSEFCRPIKLVLGKTILGIGASVSFGNTYWLAHIIVDLSYRNLGLGYRIVNKLIKDIENNNPESILLIATDLGEPVYKKAGFKTSSEYSVFKRAKPWIENTVSNNIICFNEKYRNEIYKLDKHIICEDRKALLSNVLDSSLLYIENGNVLGYYIPDFVNGPILGLTKESGIELMNLKYANVDKAILPLENKAGRGFLKRNGFKETFAIKRMIRGQKVNWKPEHVFSRIGGNFG